MVRPTVVAPAPMPSAAGYPHRLAASPPVTDPASPASPLLALSRPCALALRVRLELPSEPRRGDAEERPRKQYAGERSQRQRNRDMAGRRERGEGR